MGIDKAEYTRRFGSRLIGLSVVPPIGGTVLDETPEHIRLTPEGLGYSDYIGQLFILQESGN